MSVFGTNQPPWTPWQQPATRTPLKVSTRTMGAAIENALIGSFTRSALEIVLTEELDLTWRREDIDPKGADTKRVSAYDLTCRSAYDLTCRSGELSLSSS